MARTVATITATILLSVAILSANLWHRQHSNYLEGVAGERSGDFMKALTGYESAIRMHLPLSSKGELSASRIWAMAEMAEKRGDLEYALIAYRSLRSAFYATRWLRQPGEDWINRSDAKIALLAPLRMKVKP